MDWIRILISRCATLFRKQKLDKDLEEELRTHIELAIEENKRHGMSEQTARTAALRAFGGVTQAKEQYRTQGGLPLLETLAQDIRYGLRQLGNHWAATLLAILTLGIGTGAVAAVFSILYAVVLRPLPFPNPDRIVTVWSTRDGQKDEVTPRNFDSWRRNSRSFQQLAAMAPGAFTLSQGGSVRQVTGGEVTSNFFSVFGASPVLGRTFTNEEGRPPRRNLVVLSHRFWQQQFAQDRGVLGREIRLDREAYTIIGVMPASFDLRPHGEQFWIPLALNDQAMHWTGGMLYVFGRLQPHVPLGQAQAEMKIQAQILQARYPEMNRGRDIRVDEFAQDLVGDYRRQLLILLAAVGSVFLIASSNVANLLLARTTGRSRELTIRAALGASRARILRQLLTESLLLGLAGAALGLAVAAAAIRIVKSTGAAAIPRLADSRVNLPVLILLLALAVLCTLLSGVLPALRAAKLGPQSVLAQGERSVAGLARDRARNTYVAFEVGLALVLLVVAGLLIRTAIEAQKVQPGFDPDNVIAGRTALPASTYLSEDQITGAYERILDALASDPGVRAAALTSQAPLGLSTMGVTLHADAVSPPLRQEFSVNLQYVSPGYFAAMQIPLRHGREFNAHDRAGSAGVVLVNEALAHRLWSAADPVGDQLRLPEFDSKAPLREVVGVVANIHDDGLMAEPPAVLYIPVAQVTLNPWHWTGQSLYLIARTQTGSAAGSEILRAALRKVDPGLPLGDTLTMSQRLAQSLSAARLYALLLTALGLCGMVLTAAGIYGVVAYYVSRQRAEIGIRMALGATRGEVLRFVVEQGMRPVLAGIGLGFAILVGGSRVLESELFQAGAIHAMDPLTVAAVIGLLLAIALLACYFPARQAARIDPMIALRSQ